MERKESIVMRIVLVISLMAIGASAASPRSTSQDLDFAFEEFLREHDYRGGAIAAMKDGRLIYATGQGHDREGQRVKAGSHFPVSSLAKSLTAVAVMRLVQDGEVALDDKIFGVDGILDDIEPYRVESVPPELFSITVDHLLRHTAGWDVTKAPLYDPLLNDVYINRGQDVPNIARELGVRAPVLPDELISYVMSLPLSFTPGTQTAYSNMAYVVLGRVVEAITGSEYRDYVKKMILDKCGMWNTRLQLSPSLDPTDVPIYDPETSSLYDVLVPESVDSALGWYSNAYDLLRFSRCVFDTDTVLNDHHLELLLAKSPSAPIQHDDTWYCAGFRTNAKNIVWQDADPHADDLILYHDLERHDGPKSRRPDTWVVLLHGRKVNHLRHHSRELMTLLENVELGADENLFAYDLSQLHAHPVFLDTPRQRFTPEYTVKYRLDEHRLTAYMVALKGEGYSLAWVTSYTIHGHTYFLVVGRRTVTVDPGLAERDDFMFEHGMTPRTLLKTKLQMEQAGYNMTQLHSYRSRSHLDPTSFAAVFRRRAFATDTQMKYGTSHLPQPYEKLVQMYHEKQFYPLSQTVVFHHKDEEFSFVYIKKNTDRRVDFLQYYDLTAKRLSKLTRDNTRNQLRLSYLNAYDVKGKFKFSAVFNNATRARGVLELEQPENRISEITIYNLGAGLVPTCIVPYFTDNKELRYAAYFQEQQ